MYYPIETTIMEWSVQMCGRPEAGCGQDPRGIEKKPLFQQVIGIHSRRGRIERMDRQYSVGAYRAIDLTLFAVILCVFETVIIRASRSLLFRDQAFTVSLAAAIVSIVFMRWGVWGGIHAALAGAVYCIFGGGTPSQFAVYIIGNLFSLAALLFLRKVGSERIRASVWLSFAFGLLVLLLMQLGRFAVSLLLGSPVAEAFRFFTTDSLSAVFTLVIIWVVRRLDGVWEDQLHYLKRFRSEEDV